MKKIFLLAAAIILLTAITVSAETSSLEVQKILDAKCNKCHTLARVDKAMQEHRDLTNIQTRMIKHGAQLDNREQQVLGIFFRDYAVTDADKKVRADDPLAEYRSVVQARCTGCHALDIVENAMRQKRQFGTLAQMMIKRGAVLNDKDMKIIQTFWGEPLR